MDPSTAIYFRYANNRLNLKKRIATLLRYVEVVVLITIALWSSARIPAAAGALVRHVIPVVVGPHFLFLMANAIVLSLFLLKPQTTTAEADKKNSIADEISASLARPSPSARAEDEGVVFEDKRVCVGEEGAPQRQHHVRRAYRRSGSGVAEGGKRRRRCSSELRRAETDVGRVDEEEFRKMVDAFIEKQWKFQREESMAIVCSHDFGAGLYGQDEITVEK